MKCADVLRLPDAQNLLRDLLKSFRECYVVLDGPDERVPDKGEGVILQTRHQLLDAVLKVIPNQGPTVRILLSSREQFKKMFWKRYGPS